MTYVTDILWSLWYGAAVFALGIPLYLLASPDPIPTWITLGGAAVMGVWVAIHNAVTEIGSTRRTRKWFARPSRYHPPPPQPEDDQPPPLPAP